MDIRKNFRDSLRASNVKKVIIYEEVKGEKVSAKDLTKEQRIDLIRFGTDILNKPKTKPVDLLAKYKPIINLKEYRILADRLEK